ncbi:MAG: cation:dicarboxylase symporter family transporter, partial [Flavobacteriales bacterium]|nr:cation:dicarboxylase symporter family transporter [Flavobacteriales bacterium]
MTSDSPRSASKSPRLALHWQVLIGLALGVGYAWASIQFGWNSFTLNYIQPLGDIFINILKLIAVPLVLFSIIGGVASLGDVKKLGRLGAKTIGLYLLTTFFAVTLGLVLVNLFQPGTGASEDLKTSNRIRYELWRDANGIEVLDELHVAKAPENADLVLEIQAQQEGMNAWVADKLNKADNASNSGPLQPLVDVVPKNIFKALSDMAMLQIIFFAV